MEYYYAQCEQKDKAKYLEAFLSCSNNQEVIFMDDEYDDSQWERLHARLEAKDIVYIMDLSHMSMDTAELKNKLRITQAKQIRLCRLDHVTLLVDQLLEAIDFTLHEGMYKQKLRQRKGIQKALEDKKQGKGSYGRPKTQLPEDFEEHIRMIMAKQMSHESYRSALNMKRSTYFKMVKELKESWKQKEHSIG